MNLVKNWYGRINKLCTPAYVYLVVSTIALVMIVLQNTNSRNMFCVGNYSCPVQNNLLVFLLQAIYIVFWTWVLNLICKAGVPIVSWVLVLFPLLLMFFMIGSFVLFNNQLDIKLP